MTEISLIINKVYQLLLLGLPYSGFFITRTLLYFSNIKNFQHTFIMLSFVRFLGPVKLGLLQTLDSGVHYGLQMYSF